MAQRKETLTPFDGCIDSIGGGVNPSEEWSIREVLAMSPALTDTEIAKKLARDEILTGVQPAEVAKQRRQLLRDLAREPRRRQALGDERKAASPVTVAQSVAKLRRLARFAAEIERAFRKPRSKATSSGMTRAEHCETLREALRAVLDSLNAAEQIAVGRRFGIDASSGPEAAAEISRRIEGKAAKKQPV